MIHVWGSLEKGVRLKGTKLAERPSKPSICFWQTCKLSVNSSLSFSNCCTFSSSSGIWWSLWSWAHSIENDFTGWSSFPFFCIKHLYCYHSNLNLTERATNCLPAFTCVPPEAWAQPKVAKCQSLKWNLKTYLTSYNLNQMDSCIVTSPVWFLVPSILSFHVLLYFLQFLLHIVQLLAMR